MTVTRWPRSRLRPFDDRWPLRPYQVTVHPEIPCCGGHHFALPPAHWTEQFGKSSRIPTENPPVGRPRAFDDRITAAVCTRTPKIGGVIHRLLPRPRLFHTTRPLYRPLRPRRVDRAFDPFIR